jgi:hypothetical protein
MASSEPLETDITIFDEERARETVIDYVQTHPGCSKEEIWNVKENKVGKKKLNRILPDLIEEQIIEEGEPRGRKKPLFVNGANPYTVVLSELKNFEKLYFSILNKTINACNNGRYLGDLEKPSYNSNVEDLVKSVNAAALMWQPLHIFYGFMELYMFKLFTNWSREIRDKDVLQKVNNIIFAKFTQMRIDTYKKMKSASDGVGVASIELSYVKLQMNTIYRLNEDLKTLKKYGMEKDVDLLSQFIDRIFINEETRSYFRKKRGSLYRWYSKYKKEDIEVLAEDMARHPDWMDDPYSS